MRWRLLVVPLFLGAAAKGEAMDNAAAAEKPIVIAHRGASGYRPEHTLAAYRLAIQQGADFIEPDLVLTKDGVLIARHDNLLDFTTNVAQLAQQDEAIARLKTTKTVDGKQLRGWFAEDFTLAQIKELRAVERIPEQRPASAAYDGRHEIPTLSEVIALAKERQVGLYPETKHPTHFAQQTGMRISEVLLDALQTEGVDRFADLPVFIQSFEVANLKWLHDELRRRGMDLRLVQLLGSRGQPYDAVVAGKGLDYRQMASCEGLEQIAQYAHGVGPEKYTYILPKDAQGRIALAHATRFVRDAHRAGLLVHPYTFRAENAFLPAQFQRGDAADPKFDSLYGDALGEMRMFLATGIDGLFTDHPDQGRAAVDAN